MKYSVVILALLTLSGAIVQPHKQHQHQHQKYHEKRDVVWTTECIWVDGDATPVPPNSSTTTSHIPTTSTISSSEIPVQFHESPTSSPQVPSTSTSVAPYVPPTPSTSSVYVPPAAPTSTYVAPVVDSVTSPAYVAPTTTEAPAATTTAPAQATASSSGSSSGGTCSYESPCTGDLTYYTAGLGACGLTTDGDKEMVIVLPHDFMGTQSNGNPYCGKTVTISFEGTSITATVVDKCMGCTGYSIDLSNLAFSSLGINFAQGRVRGSWYFND
jgi:cytoskeletal protein RodZ